MITEEKYLKAKKIVDAYLSENKKKVGRPILVNYSREEKIVLIQNIFSGKTALKYIELIYAISEKTNLGITSSKKLAKELKDEKIIIQKNGLRSMYYAIFYT